MKRAQQEEEKCRRLELKCRLYGIIKELDRSMKSECGCDVDFRRGPGGRPPGMETPREQKKPKGSECCCPPGCCKESMEFRMPRLPPKEKPLDPADTQGQGAEDGEGTGYLGWHDDSHAWGCRPVGEAWPGSQCGRWCDEDRAGPSQGAEGIRGGSPWTSLDNPQGTTPRPFDFPQTPEEAIARGCFVARSA